MTTARSRLAIGAGLAALILGSATVGAGAAGLIGSKDIRDNSIKSVDIKDGTIAGRDVKDGSLTGDDVAGGLKARPGPDRIVTWTGSYSADGDKSVLIPSSDTIPATSLVRGLDLAISGDQSTCDTLSLAVRPVGKDPVAARRVYTADPDHSSSAYRPVVTTQAAPMEITASCNDGQVEVPSFGFTAKFSVTQLDAPPTTGTFE